MLPEEAVTVTVETVLIELGLLLQPTKEITRSRSRLSGRARRRRRKTAPKQRRPPPSAASMNSPERFGLVEPGSSVSRACRATVWMVRVDWTTLPAGERLAGLKAQVAPVGRPEQVKVTG